MLGFDDDGMRCSLVGIEYKVQPKTVVLTYQRRTLRSSFSSFTSSTWS